MNGRSITSDGEILPLADPFAVELVPNPNARRNAPYTERQSAILSDDGLFRARGVIGAWRGYRPTPLHRLDGLAARLDIGALHVKDEGSRFGLGSFKALGGAYAVAELLAQTVERYLRRPVPIADVMAGRHRDIAQTLTVCCATDGNHGRSVAWGAQRFGCHCVIFLHATVSAHRQEAIERYGACVIRTAGGYDDSVREAAAQADQHGWHVVSDTSYAGYTDVPRRVMQGYEVMAAEAYEALEERGDGPPTHIVIQTGVGGLAAAVAALAKRRWGSQRPTVVLADPQRAPCCARSFADGGPAQLDGDCDTVMAGLACGSMSLLAYEILADHAEAALTVSDEGALEAMRRLADPPPPDPAIVAGESATAGLAALIGAMADPSVRDALALGPHARVLLFATEADTDPALYETIVGRPARMVAA